MGPSMRIFGKSTAALPRRISYGLSDLRGDVFGGLTFFDFSRFDFSRTQYIDDTAAVIISELIGAAMAARLRTIVIAGLL